MDLNQTESADEGYAVLSTNDYVIFFLSITATFVIAIWTSFKNKNTTDDFFTARGSMGSIPVALSLMSSYTHAHFILAFSGEAYGFGLQLMLQLVSGLFGMFIITYTNLKLFYELNVSTIYEYFEMRYKSKHARKCLSAVQLVSEMMAMSSHLYIISLILSTMTAVNISVFIVTFGIVCAFYSTIGGMRGVIWTDSFMLLVIIVGLVAVIVTGCLEKGLIDIWTIAESGGRTQIFNFDPSIYQRQNSYFVLLNGFLIFGFRMGSSQIALQRLYAGKSFNAYKRSLIIIAFSFFSVNALNYASGLVAYASYAGCDPFAQGKIKKVDQILPYMVIDKLSYLHGLSGLFLASMVCAGVSTVTSLMNAFSNLVYSDFLQPLTYFRRASGRANIITCKVITMCLAIPVIIVAILVSKVDSLVELASVFFGLIYGSLEGIYILALFFPRTNWINAVIGFTSSLLLMIWLVVGRVATGVSFKPLPLSTDYCGHNGTDYSFLEADLNEVIRPFNMYDLSIHFYSVFGTLLSALIGFCCSYVPAKCMKSSDVPPELISSLVRKFYYKPNNEPDPSNSEDKIEATKL